ncbi:class I SAM-dependent methyltransferase [Dactylosporangium darangshiense]|uniref:Class I SAM-dependent methyltransferase n=1 Tax=Dactylosporangium darangshiense TaxID=579108 RepID=A0ABP8D9G1_9ACTN
MHGTRGFDELVAEAAGVAIEGWDFGWLDGRAVGSDPSWSYPAMAAELVRSAGRLLDIDTGGGEFLASLAPLAAHTIAVEGWAPNMPVARRRLAPLGVEVRFAPDKTLPVGDADVDVVLDRHGRLEAEEIARVLRAGGWLLTQQVGSDDCAELNEALGAPAARGTGWNAESAARAVAAAGLDVVDVREERPGLAFYDVGAVVYQLRAVPWQVPDFTVERYADGLRRIDEHIRGHGEFRVHAHRFLIRGILRGSPAR